MLRLVVTLEVVAGFAWLWVCRFAGLDEDRATGCVVWGIFFGFPILGITSLSALAINAVPIDLPPHESRRTGLPQFTIGCLMSVVAVAAVAIALFMYS